MSHAEQTAEFCPVWSDELASASKEIPWLWRGFLAPGLVTLLTSQWKAGKTTLAAALLARLKTGGPFAGLDLRPGRAVVITEESSLHWYERNRTLAFGDQMCFFCRPFAGRPRPAQWQRLLETVLDLHAQRPFDLVLVDPLAPFLPLAGENSAPAMLDFLLTLQSWTAAGLAVWLQHHPRKGRVLEGQAARGSGALPGFVDVLVEMAPYQRGNLADRRRRLVAWSRFAATAPRLVLELSAEGSDYFNHGAFEEDGFKENWKHLHVLFQEAMTKLTRREILSSWPPDFPAPAAATLWRWLERAVGEELLRTEGQGSRLSPFRYWLPELETEAQFQFQSEMQRVSEETAQFLRRAQAEAFAGSMTPPREPRSRQRKIKVSSSTAPPAAEPASSASATAAADLLNR